MLKTSKFLELFSESDDVFDIFTDKNNNSAYKYNLQLHLKFNCEIKYDF